jgi:glutathione S-transferase
LKLYTNPASPFARKARFIAHALGLPLEDILTRPLEDENLRRINPLGMIPALMLDDGTVVIDSRVICEYLDDLGGGRFFPKDGRRWKVLTLQALGDGISDAAVSYAVLGRENPVPAGRRARNVETVLAGLDALENTEFFDPPMIGEIAAACAIDCAIAFVISRQSGLDWQMSRPRLAAWYAKFCEHPSMRATA